MKRRTFLGLSSLFALPVIAKSKKSISITHGCSVGEVDSGSAIIWCRASEAARMFVELSENPLSKKEGRTGDVKTYVKTYRGAVGIEENDFNCKALLTGLKSNTQYYFRIYCLSLSDSSQSDYEIGQFQTASENELSDIRFCWSGDTAGQGYGIDAQHGGMLTYKTMHERNPDFFVHCGDQIYADNPLEAKKAAPDGVEWNNELTVGKAKVAETTQEFRENVYYNFNDQHVLAFHRNVPTYHMWDDHEVVNNWYPGEILEDERYSEKRVSILAARAKRAFVDCLPVLDRSEEGNRLYRHVSRGPLLDLFFVDLRSYRSPNSENRQSEASDQTQFWGEQQLTWLKSALKNAKGLWKIMCIDMPISVRVNEWGTEIAENAANGDGPALGRELEYKELFEFIHKEGISNVHFITADVHYCASYYCHPKVAREKSFTPFWEFVSGPLHAGTFGPNDIDPTFGPVAEFIGLPDDFEPGASPAANLQFFGEMSIDANTKTLTVRHLNRTGSVLWQKKLTPIEPA